MKRQTADSILQDTTVVIRLINPEPTNTPDNGRETNIVVGSVNYIDSIGVSVKKEKTHPHTDKPYYIEKLYPWSNISSIQYRHVDVGGRVTDMGGNLIEGGI
jgi:hypothetical protein